MNLVPRTLHRWVSIICMVCLAVPGGAFAAGRGDTARLKDYAERRRKEVRKEAAKVRDLGSRATDAWIKASGMGDAERARVFEMLKTTHEETRGLLSAEDETLVKLLKLVAYGPSEQIPTLPGGEQITVASSYSRLALALRDADTRWEAHFVNGGSGQIGSARLGKDGERVAREQMEADRAGVLALEHYRATVEIYLVAAGAPRVETMLREYDQARALQQELWNKRLKARQAAVDRGTEAIAGLAALFLSVRVLSILLGNNTVTSEDRASAQRELDRLNSVIQGGCLLSGRSYLPPVGPSVGTCR